VLHVVWEFRVRAGLEAEFEARYGPDGDWVRLFRGGDGHASTALLCDPAVRGRYLVIDVWRDAVAYRTFKETFAAEYAALDEQCAALTEDERRLGEFESV
jgi:quinol monooxygenase YgiN